MTYLHRKTNLILGANMTDDSADAMAFVIIIALIVTGVCYWLAHI
jgi:hypothetical protein